MNGQAFHDLARLAARQERGPHPLAFGYVAAYQPAQGTVTVYIPPDVSAARGPFPLLCPAVGDGWGVTFGPTGGDLDASGTPKGEPCIVLFPDPAGQFGIVLPGYFDDAMKSPGPPKGEIWLKHKNGQAIKLKGDGTITAGDGSETPLATKALADYCAALNTLLTAFLTGLNAGTLTPQAAAALGLLQTAQSMYLNPPPVTAKFKAD